MKINKALDFFKKLPSRITNKGFTDVIVEEYDDAYVTIKRTIEKLEVENRSLKKQLESKV